MADGSPSIRFLKLHQNAFYFGVDDNALEGDNLIEGHRLEANLSYTGGCSEKFLTLKTTRPFETRSLQFETRSLPTSEIHKPENIFHILLYQSASEEADEGTKVVLYNEIEGRKMVACCSNTNEICPKEMEPPNEEPHEAVFCLRWQSDTHCTFESTKHKSKYLAFESINANIVRLVLREVPKNEVNEHRLIKLTECSA